MSKGKKLNLFIGAQMNETWSELTTQRKTVVIQEKLDSCKHFLYFSKEKRRGKTVTIVGEFFLEQDSLKNLLKTIKKKLGCGGLIKDNFLEIQGDLKKQLKIMLTEKNYRFKNGH